MNLTPIDDRVLIKVHVEEDSYHGILLPGSTDNTKTGTIVAVGPGMIDFMTPRNSTDEVLRIPMTVKVGQKVMINNVVGTKIVYNGEDYTLQRQNELLIIINEE